MPFRTTAEPQVHLHWVRETPTRGLDLPVSRTVFSLDSLPACVRDAVRATGLESVEAHLPPYRPAFDPDLDTWLSGLRFRQDAAGRLVGALSGDADPQAAMAFHQAMVLIARAVTCDATPLTIVAEPGRSPLLAQPLASRHRCAPGGGLTGAPAERSGGYNRTYKRLSAAIQVALRDTVPPAHLLSLEQLEDRDHVHALLAWGAAEPVVGRHVDALAVEVLKPNTVQSAFSGLPTRLSAKLAEVREILVRQRASGALCDAYDPALAPKIATRCLRRPRYLNLLFSNEFRLIYAFVAFCGKIKGWRQRAAGNPVSIFREARNAWLELESHFRGFYQRHPHSPIGSLLLVEALRALEAVD